MGKTLGDTVSEGKGVCECECVSACVWECLGRSMWEGVCVEDERREGGGRNGE